MRPLILGFRGDERLSKMEASLPANNKLAGSGGVLNSTKMPVGTDVDGCGLKKGSASDSKVSCRSVMKVEIFNLEPFLPNKIDASDGSVGSISVADGSSISRFRSRSDKSVGGSSKSRVFLRGLVF